jgi:hypothetical protein
VILACCHIKPLCQQPQKRGKALTACLIDEYIRLVFNHPALNINIKNLPLSHTFTLVITFWQGMAIIFYKIKLIGPINLYECLANVTQLAASISCRPFSVLLFLVEVRRGRLTAITAV